MLCISLPYPLIYFLQTISPLYLTFTDVLCIAEELHCITGKQVDVYAACEINAGSAFYDAILEEGVQIA